MNLSSFFDKEPVKALLGFAREASAMPVSLHLLLKTEGGGPRGADVYITGSGRCRACRLVCETADGRAACRESRLPAMDDALRRRTPSPFLCHMGFACVAAPALSHREAAYVLTCGPFCPAETPQALAADVRDGLAALGLDSRPPIQDLLDDVPRAPTPVAPTVLRWLKRDLDALWDEAAGETAPSEPVPEDALLPALTQRRSKARPPASDPLGAHMLAAALAGGKKRRARSLLETALAANRAAAPKAHEWRHARTISLAGAILEAASEAGLATAPVWDALPGFMARLDELDSPADAVESLLELLAPLQRRAERRATKGDTLTKLSHIVETRLAECITLKEVARQLDKSPTALTHYMQRNFGVSFSEYMGKTRVSKAKELLRRTRLSVADIGRRVGIKDASNFCKLFRSHEGLSPREYRDKHGKKK